MSVAMSCQRDDDVRLYGLKRKSRRPSLKLAMPVLLPPFSLSIRKRMTFFEHNVATCCCVLAGSLAMLLAISGTT